MGWRDGGMEGRRTEISRSHFFIEIQGRIGWRIARSHDKKERTQNNDSKNRKKQKKAGPTTCTVCVCCSLGQCIFSSAHIDGKSDSKRVPLLWSIEQIFQPPVVGSMGGWYGRMGRSNKD